MNKTFDIKKIDLTLLVLALILLAVGFLFTRMIKKINPVQKKDTVLVFTQWWQDELEAETLSVLKTEFEALNPGVTVQLDNRPYAEILSTLRSNVEAPLNSDILGLDPLWFEDLVRQDLLEELDTYNPSGDPSLGTPPAVPDQSYEKWGRHLISFTSPLFYNIELLQSAGFDRPPKSRAEILTYARSVTDKSTGQYALALALSPENPQGVYRDLFSWIWASGPAMTREGRPDFSARTITGALAFLKQLRQEEFLLPGTFTRTAAEKREDFIQGRSAMMISSVADIHVLRKRMGESAFGITAIPGESSFGGKPVLGLTGWYLGILRSSEHKDEAWAFLSFLLERGALITEKAHAVPGSRNNAIDFITGDPLYAKAYDMYTVGETVQEFTGVPRVDEFESLVREQVYALFEKNQSPEETAKRIQQHWEEL
ncbi:ABC transporter substrate-binding protein [Treponema primitia]|uniref:ABC transporter substrate-binding protein n=1 Tax=Treponema primitia TaxID=88058 RepID=UPI0002554DB0|nr:extracellular solute-binding protein [Treponema primitia]